MKTYPILILLASTLLFACSQKPLSKEEYLSQNKVEVNFSEMDDLSDLRILDTKTGAKVFLGGETHQVACNPHIQFKLLKYLHQNADVRYCMLELPHSFAWTYNKELEKDSMANWMANEPFYRMVYEYNQILNVSERIRFIGADIERFQQQTLFVLNELIKSDAELPEAISLRMGSISDLCEDLMKTRMMNDSISTSLRQLAYDLQSHLEVEKAAYSGYLLENYIDFEVIVNSLVGGYEAKWGESGELDNEQEIGVREKSMFNTFAKFYPHLKGNVFGQWGSMHVRQDTTGIERLNDETETWTNPETFAYQLNHHPNSPVRGKVISIGYNYVNCFTSQLNRQHTDERIPTKSILDKVTENELIETSESDFTLFRLNSGNSPFTDLSADFQYILLIQNQLAQ